MGILVSVVIPTYRRLPLLKRCIECLLQQTLEPSLYEVIVVDDGRCVLTRRYMEQIMRSTSFPTLRYFNTQGRRGPATARNIGWKAAAASVIAFTDDDCLPEPAWLERGLARMSEGFAGVSGRIVVPRGISPTDYELNTSFLETAEFATANCFYQRDVLAEVGGFDERFTRAWREDADLFFTLIKQGKRLTTAQDAVVIHPVRPGSWGVSIREQSKSVFNALLFKKHPTLYREKIRNRLLLRYYAVVLSGLLSLVCIVFGFYSIGVAAFFVWSFATLSVCFTRLKGTSHAPRHVLEMLVTSLFIPFLSVFWRLAGAVRFNVLFF